MRGIGLGENDLSGWDFSGQHLAGAYFGFSDLSDADFSFADLRKAEYWDPSATTVVRNAIRPDGEIRGLGLTAGEVLVIRNVDLGITVTEAMTLAEDATLRFVLDGDAWGSTVFLAEGVVPELGGVLELIFAEGVDIAALTGTTFKLFEWNDLLADGQTFDAIVTQPGLVWDTRSLYTTGEIRLIPEPCTAALVLLGGLAAVRRRARNDHR